LDCIADAAFGIACFARLTFGFFARSRAYGAGYETSSKIFFIPNRRETILRHPADSREKCTNDVIKSRRNAFYA